MTLKKIKFAAEVGKRILPDKDRKPLRTIYQDLRWIKNKSPFKDKSIKHYFECLMYKRDAGAIEHYLPNRVQKDIRRITRHYNKHVGYHPILEDKRQFKELAIREDIPTAGYLAKIKDGILTTSKGLQIKLENKDALKQLFMGWLKNNEGVFIKRIDSWKGEDVYRVKNFKEFFKINIRPNDEYIIEKEVQQINALNKINPHCLMTLRVVSLLQENDVHILGAYLRTGFGKSPVDNVSAGGIFVKYDIYNNKLDNVGYQRWGFGGKSYLKHPNTGFVFKNKPLPYPEKIINLVKKAAKAVPSKELIGWDVAYTEDGPIIIEGNSFPALAGVQVNLKGLLSNRHFKELLYEYFNTDGTVKNE